MKTYSDFIWHLIHSLNSKEKLYFKRNFINSGSAGNNLYVRLFDAISSQKKYNETAILKKFHPGLNKKNISSQKNYLQRQVCNALVLYNSRDHTGHEVYSDILLIRIYRKKGLLEEAHRIWKKAMAKARETESYALVNMLKTEFEKMVLFSGVHAGNDELHSIFKEHIISYSGYAEIITLRDLYAETILLKRKAHFDIDKNLRTKINQLHLEIDKSNISTYGTSFWFRHYYYMGKATLLYLSNEISASFVLLKQVFLDWKKNKQFIKTEGEYYIELLYMINYAGILHGSYKYVADVFDDEINDLIDETGLKDSFEAIKYLALNKIYNKTARYDDAKKLVQSMKTKYSKWEPVLNTDLNMTVNLSMGISCFVLEQYHDALFFTKRGVTYFKKDTREESIAVAQILLLLITYNLNNSRLFDAQQKTTYTYFYKRKKKHPFETALVQCLSRTFYMKDNKSKIEAYKKTLEILEKSKNDPVQLMAFSIFNYPGWLISRVEGIDYTNYVRKKVKENATFN